MKVINLIFPALLSMSIPIDMLNGYVLNTYDTGVVSQIYKSFIILVCFSILIIKTFSCIMVYLRSNIPCLRLGICARVKRRWRNNI